MRRESKRKPRRKRQIVSGYQQYPAPYKVVNKTYVIQFRNLITVTSNGSGVISGMIPCDPSATLSAPFASGALFPEWTNVAALFSAIKCIQLECTFVPSTSDEVKGDSQFGVSIAHNRTSISNFATSYAATEDNEDSQTWNAILDQSGRGRYHAFRHLKSLNWGGTATPASSAAVYAGAVGGIGMYCSTAVSLQLFTVHVCATYVLGQRS